MSTHPHIFRTVEDIYRQVSDWRKQGQRIGLVPTMGALHNGHLSLINSITPKVDKVIVSIFVNPTQFAAGEDYVTYPRTEETDLEKLSTVNANAVFAPTASEIYADGFTTRLNIGGPAEGLESVARPHLFGGVGIVVTKLLTICQPDYAIFGEKDYQQLLVIKRLVADLNLPVRILAAPILREDDGLAISSRNMYLDVNQRQIAGQLNKVLQNLCNAKQQNASLAELETLGKEKILKAGFDAVDYLTFRDAQNLSLPDEATQTLRLLVAARLGLVRLIDNMPV